MPSTGRLGTLAFVLFSAACTGTTASDTDTLPVAAGIVRPPPVLFREYLVLEGTTLHVRLDSGVDSATSAVDDAMEGTLTEAVVVNGTTVAPVGSRVTGAVAAVEPSATQGRSSLAFQFGTLVVSGHRDAYAIAPEISRVTSGDTQDDVITIGAPPAAGAAGSDILGRKAGATIWGASAAGGTGTGVELTATGRDISLPAGTLMTMALTAPIKIRIPLIRR